MVTHAGESGRRAWTSHLPTIHGELNFDSSKCRWQHFERWNLNFFKFWVKGKLEK